ncbi:hypothetical protein B0T13DRAFT_462632 [Neurospora crassa]|nr:hypothetical protein B0T13DRAFT_462632 [Neurospora crassa]
MILVFLRHYVLPFLGMAIFFFFFSSLLIFIMNFLPVLLLSFPTVLLSHYLSHSHNTKHIEVEVHGFTEQHNNIVGLDIYAVSYTTNVILHLSFNLQSVQHITRESTVKAWLVALISCLVYLTIYNIICVVCVLGWVD